MLKKSAKAAGTAAVVVASVAVSAAVSVATDGSTGIYSLQPKKAEGSAKENDSDGVVENGRHVHYPVYELTPLVRLGKRWYNPFTLKQVFLKDHRVPKRIRYADIRLKKPKKSKTKKRATKSKNFIKEKKERDIRIASSVRDKRSNQSRAVIADQSQDEQRTVVSRKTTEFADGSFKKEVFFSGTSQNSLFSLCRFEF